MERLADLAIASLRSQVDGRRRPRCSCSTAGSATSAAPTTALRAAPHSPGSSTPWPTSAVPRIHFGVNTGELLGPMAATGADVVGVDWRVPLDEAGRRVGPGAAPAGQPRPGALPRAVAGGREPRSGGVLAAQRRPPGGHIFNLGHGVLPETDPAVLERVVELVARLGVPTTRGDAAARARPTMSPTGVVVMAYGTPGAPDDVEAYYTDIRRGRPPTPEQLADLVRRYDAIGGIVAAGRAHRGPAARRWPRPSTSARPGGFEVVLGQKHAAPFIEDAVRGPGRPGHRPGRWAWCWPRTTRPPAWASTRQRAAAAGAEVGVDVRRHRRAGTSSPPTSTSWPPRWPRPAPSMPEHHKVLFTAHSLPERALVDDPYPDQLRQSGRGGGRAGRAATRGPTGPSPGRARAAPPSRGGGPTSSRSIARARRQTGRSDGVVVCAQGFTSDHLEVLYDLDIEAAAVARDAGLAFARTRSLNDDPTVMAALADRVIGVLDRGRRPDRRGGQSMAERRIAVVGGGITGLSAAFELVHGTGPEHDAVDVAVLEAGERFGRQDPHRGPSPATRSTRRPTPSWPGCPTPSSCAASSGLADQLVTPGGPQRLPVQPRRAAARSPTGWCSACPPTSTRWPRSGAVSPEGVAAGRART